MRGDNLGNKINLPPAVIQKTDCNGLICVYTGGEYGLVIPDCRPCRLSKIIWRFSFYPI